MSISLHALSENKHVYRWLYGAGSVLLVAAIVVWWFVVSIRPERVFWNMISNSLQTAGVTSQVHQEGQGTAIDQTLQYAAGTTNAAHALTVIKQGSAVVKTELVGNPNKTYTRYTAIETGGKTDKKKLASIVNVWAASDATSETNTNLFSQSVLGIGLPIGAVPVPIANLSDRDRAALIRQMHDLDLYSVSHDKVKKAHKNGRLVYEYQVKIQPIVYLNVMKTFAKTIGMPDLDNIDANSYSGAEAVTVTVRVDARAGQLVGVSMASGYSQTYASHGMAPHVTMPSKAISADELTKRLGALQE